MLAAHNRHLGKGGGAMFWLISVCAVTAVALFALAWWVSGRPRPGVEDPPIRQQRIPNEGHGTEFGGGGTP